MLVAGGTATGVYYAFKPKHSTPTRTHEPIVESPTDHKSSDGGSVNRIEELVPDVALPSTFADQLRPRTFVGHGGAFNALAVSGSGSRLVSAGADGTIRIWSVATDQSFIRESLRNPAVATAWYASNRGIMAADSSAVSFFDAAGAKSPRTLASPRGAITCVAITNNGSRAIAGLNDGSVRLWDTAAGRFDEWAIAARGPVTSVDFSTDATQALVAIADGPVSLWNLTNHSRVQEWSPHKGGAVAVRFSPDGSRAATCGPDGTATIYDLAANKELSRLNGHTGPVTGIAWTPDGRQVVTVSVDRTARLWAAGTGQPLRWVQALDGEGNCVAVDPGGRYVLAGTATGTIHLLPLPRVKAETVSGPPAKPPHNPLAVPDPDAVATAIAGVRAQRAREFAFNRPDDMALLADNLRRRALVDRLSPAQRFGLLHESRSLATRAGDPITAFQAIEDAAAWFDIDELAEKATTLAALPVEAGVQSQVALGLNAAERAELDDRPQVLERFLKRLPESPTGIAAEVVARLTALRKRASAAAAERKAVRQALAVLKNAPDDPTSNQVVGAYLCFSQQDWIRGLPMLAKGTDARLIEAAKTDLTAPTDPKARHSLGELWLKLARDQTDERGKRTILRRARSLVRARAEGEARRCRHGPGTGSVE